MRGWPARPPGNSRRQAALAAVFMVARLAASSVSIAAKGSGTGAGGAEADEHLAIVVDDVVACQADQAGVLRCSDDDHIVRELGEPPPPDRAATHPAPVAGPGQIPASEHPGTRPGGHLPGPGRAPGRGPPAAKGPRHTHLGPGRALPRAMAPGPGPRRSTGRPLAGRPVSHFFSFPARLAAQAWPDWRPGPRRAGRR